jgi:hypothetical protein
VGQLTALAFAAAVDDPSRFRRSRDLGAYLGLVQRRYQSGEIDCVGIISKIGTSHSPAASPSSCAPCCDTPPSSGRADIHEQLREGKAGGRNELPSGSEARGREQVMAPIL